MKNFTRTIYLKVSKDTPYGIDMERHTSYVEGYLDLLAKFCGSINLPVTAIHLSDWDRSFLLCNMRTKDRARYADQLKSITGGLLKFKKTSKVGKAWAHRLAGYSRPYAYKPVIQWYTETNTAVSLHMSFREKDHYYMAISATEHIEFPHWCVSVSEAVFDAALKRFEKAGKPRSIYSRDVLQLGIDETDTVQRDKSDPMPFGFAPRLVSSTTDDEDENDGNRKVRFLRINPDSEYGDMVNESNNYAENYLMELERFCDEIGLVTKELYCRWRSEQYLVCDLDDNERELYHDQYIRYRGLCRFNKGSRIGRAWTKWMKERGIDFVPYSHLEFFYKYKEHFKMLQTFTSRGVHYAAVYAKSLPTEDWFVEIDQATYEEAARHRSDGVCAELASRYLKGLSPLPML